jgi:hypothetical protein
MLDFSKHALEQMEARGIERDVVENGIAKPDQILKEEGNTVYQSVLADKKHLIRIFVNDKNRVITVYKTSKIRKYYEGKI